MRTDNRPFLCYYVSAYIFQAHHILGYETLYSTIFNYPRIVGFLSLSLRVLREVSEYCGRALRENSDYFGYIPAWKP